MRLKATESESNNKQPINNDIYNKILEERINEIMDMKNITDYDNLVYNFKTKGVPSINFIKFNGPFYTYNQLKNGDITLSQLEEDQKKLNQN